MPKETTAINQNDARNRRLAFAILGSLIAGGRIDPPDFKAADWSDTFESMIDEVAAVLDEYNA